LCSCWGFFNGTNLYENDKGFYEDGKLILVPELEQDCLFAAVNGVCPEITFAAQDPKLSKELGERFRHVSNLNPSSTTYLIANGISQDVSKRAYHERLSQFVKTISTLLQHGGLDETIYSR
jgi:hypothetical protein